MEIVGPFCAPFPGTHLSGRVGEEEKTKIRQVCFFPTSQTVNRASAPFPCLKISDVSPQKTSVTPRQPRGYDQTAALATRAVATWLPLPRAQLLGTDGNRCTKNGGSPGMTCDDTNTPPFIPPKTKMSMKIHVRWINFFAHLKASKSSSGFFPTTHPFKAQGNLPDPAAWVKPFCTIFAKPCTRTVPAQGFLSTCCLTSRWKNMVPKKTLFQNPRYPSSCVVIS